MIVTSGSVYILIHDDNDITYSFGTAPQCTNYISEDLITFNFKLTQTPTKSTTSAPTSSPSKSPFSLPSSLPLLSSIPSNNSSNYLIIGNRCANFKKSECKKKHPDCKLRPRKVFKCVLKPDLSEASNDVCSKIIIPINTNERRKKKKKCKKKTNRQSKEICKVKKVVNVCAGCNLASCEY